MGIQSNPLFWKPLIDKIHARLYKWKRFNLSRGVRATLCKSVLYILPTYYMSAFIMPKGVLSTLERILRNFFWEGHNGSKINQLVKWETVHKSIADGGLGLGSFKAQIWLF